MAELGGSDGGASAANAPAQLNVNSEKRIFLMAAVWPRDSLSTPESQAQITCNLNNAAGFPGFVFSRLRLRLKHGR
jgi:hypothetical protein